MTEQIRLEATRRGVSRICHFTPSRNLQHIVAGDEGVLSTSRLTADERAAFNATDLSRLDGFPGHICCSIQYPNAWYFDRARANEVLFQDWVVLLIKPDYLWREGTMFSPRNAAAGYGAHVQSGPEAFERLFASSVVGQGGVNRTRSPNHLSSCPTDQQAEVLVQDRIAKADIIGVAVRDEAQAAIERVRLEINGMRSSAFPFVIAPAMFQKNTLSNGIIYGVAPVENFSRPNFRDGHG